MNIRKFAGQYGPWALVAGASSGLGEAYAYAAAERGLNVALVARREELLKSLAKSLEIRYKVQTRVLTADLGDTARLNSIDEKTRDLDIGLLIYNAAYSLVGPFTGHTAEDHLKEIDVNTKGPLMLSYLFGERFIKRGKGGILLMSSLSSSQGSPFVLNYAATKAWNRVFAEGLWYEWKPKGVDVLSCVAGVVDTPNYRASAPAKPMKGMKPIAVARKALKALGKKPVVIPGIGNGLAEAFLRHFLPRKLAVLILGKTLQGMYGHK